MDFAEIPPSPVPAYQNQNELRALFDHVAAHPHAVVVEIGSLFGGTLWYWSHLPAIDHLVSVDLPSEWPTVFEGVRDARPNWHTWFSPRTRFDAITGDSSDPDTITRTLALLDGRPIDFLFIDGDHSYTGVRTDWLNWAPHVAPGGVVAFHDTWPNYDRHEPGVVRWVDELRHHLPSIEWTDPDGVGIAAFTTPALP